MPLFTPFRLYLELSPEFMVVPVTYKNEEDSIKNEGARVLTRLYNDFSYAQGSLLRNLWWDLAEIRTHPSFHACPR